MVQFDQAGHGRDHLTITPARGRAGAAIEFFSLRVVQPESRPSAWRIVPDGSAHLLYHAPRAGTGRAGRLCIVGARSTYCDTDLSARAFTLAVRLRPCALAALTHVPAPELRDTALPLRDVEPDFADALLAALRPLHDPHAAFRVFCRCVSARAMSFRPDPVDGQLLRTLRRRGQSVLGASRSLEASPRRLRERFRRSTGLSPKRFMRVNRLFRALDHALRTPDPNWAAIAARSGCYDQSHLINEFGELLGETPEQFLSRRGQA